MNARSPHAAVPLAFVLAFALFGPPAMAAADPAPLNAKIVAPGFAPTVRALRAQTGLPIVLPPKFEPETYISFDGASPGAYTLYVDLAPGCKGVHACGDYILSAKRATAADGRIHAKRIALGRGVDGDLTASTVTAYPTDTTIAWRLGTTAYLLSVNSHGPDPAALARSIVANLRVVTQPSTLR